MATFSPQSLFSMASRLRNCSRKSWTTTIQGTKSVSACVQSAESGNFERAERQSNNQRRYWRSATPREVHVAHPFKSLTLAALTAALSLVTGCAQISELSFE